MHDARFVFRRTAGWSSLFAAITLVGSLPTALQAQTPDCATLLCPGTVAPTPCTVTSGNSPVLVTPGSHIDCSGRDVVVNASARIRVNGGHFDLSADSLSVLDGGEIIAVAATTNTGYLGFRLDITGSVDIDGSLQADAAQRAGSISVNAAGNIDISSLGNKGVEASGTSAGADGGAISLNSDGNITIANPVRATTSGGTDATGGRITLIAGGNVTISGTAAKLFADSRKSDAGQIRVRSGGDITVGASALLTVDGHSVGGNGGAVYLTAKNKVSLSAPVSARGGIGSGGSEAMGGSLIVDSGCGGVDILGDLDLRGGEFGGGFSGGSLEIDTAGDITIGTGVSIDTHSVANGGSGGDVFMSSGGHLELATNTLIDTRGDTSSSDGDGLGGSVELRACDLDVKSGASIDTSGLEGGAILIHAQSRVRNITTLHLAGASSFKSSAADPRYDGDIDVAVVHESLQGNCAANQSISCTLDADCVIGCNPDQCDGLNPDTDDVLTQFLTTPNIEEDANISRCDNPCVP